MHGRFRTPCNGRAVQEGAITQKGTLHGVGNGRSGSGILSYHMYIAPCGAEDDQPSAYKNLEKNSCNL